MTFEPFCEVASAVSSKGSPVVDRDVLKALLASIELVRDGDGHVEDATVADGFIGGDFDAPVTSFIDATVGATVIDPAPGLAVIGGIDKEDHRVKGEASVRASDIMGVKGFTIGGDRAMQGTISVPGGEPFFTHRGEASGLEEIWRRCGLEL